MSKYPAQWTVLNYSLLDKIYTNSKIRKEPRNASRNKEVAIKPLGSTYFQLIFLHAMESQVIDDYKLEIDAPRLRDWTF